MAVTAERQRAARVGKLPGRPDPVGQVRLGRRAEAHVHATAAKQVDIGFSEVSRVHGGAAGTERPGTGQDLGGGGAVRRQAGPVLRDLLGDVDVQRRTVAMGPGHDIVHLPRRHRADRVDGGAGPRMRVKVAGGIRLKRLYPGRPGCPVGVSEAELRSF